MGHARYVQPVGTVLKLHTLVTIARADTTGRRMVCALIAVSLADIAKLGPLTALIVQQANTRGWLRCRTAPSVRQDYTRTRALRPAVQSVQWGPCNQDRMAHTVWHVVLVNIKRLKQENHASSVQRAL